MHFAAGFVIGGLAMAVYSHFFNAKVQKLADQVIAEFNKIKSKV